jgi:hypothetical protein
MCRHIALLLFALMAVVGLAWADDEVVLKDGQHIRGLEVHRVGDVFLVTLPDGGLLSLPIDSVLEVQLGEGKQPGPDIPPALLKTPPNETRAAGPALNQMPGQSDKEGTAKTLAGPPVHALTWQEQLAVFDHPWEPRPPVFSPVWTPENSLQPWQVWAPAPYKPPTWQAPTFDPVWQPTPAWNPGVDVLESGRVHWAPPVLDPIWSPGGAFDRW